MKVGQMVTFEEIWHYMERECGGVFTTAMCPPMGSELEFYVFYAMDENICLVALKTDWAYVHSVSKDYKGEWYHSDTELYRVCRILTMEQAMRELALSDGLERHPEDMGYHWIANWRR